MHAVVFPRAQFSGPPMGKVGATSYALIQWQWGRGEVPFSIGAEIFACSAVGVGTEEKHQAPRTPKAFHPSAQGWRDEGAPTLGSLPHIAPNPNGVPSAPICRPWCNPDGVEDKMDRITQGSALRRNPGLEDGTPLAFISLAERKNW